MVFGELTSHQCGADLILGWCLMWVEFFVRPCFAARVFLWVLRFLPSQKPTSQNSNSTGIEDWHKNQLRLIWPPLKSALNAWFHSTGNYEPVPTDQPLS